MTKSCKETISTSRFKFPADMFICVFPSGTISDKVSHHALRGSFVFLYQSYLFLPEISKSPVSKVPPELAKHEAAQHKVSREMKRKRDADDLG